MKGFAALLVGDTITSDNQNCTDGIHDNGQYE